MRFLSDFEIGPANQSLKLARQGALGVATCWVVRPGGVGSAVFTGVNGTISLGSSAWGFTNQSFSLEAWVKPSSVAAGNYVIIGKSNNEHYALDRSGADYRFFCRNGTGFTTAAFSSQAAVGVWAHVVGVISHTASSITLYVNGVQGQTWTINGGPALLTDSTNLYIGSRNNSDRYWAGSIDEVRIYNTALTSAQVVGLWNVAAGVYNSPQSGNLMAGYHLDEGAGTIAVDYSGNVRHGTLSGSVSFTTGDGKIFGNSTSVESQVLKAEAGVDALESGIQTLGDASGRAALQGTTIRFNPQSTERARFDSSGNLCIGRTTGTSLFHVGTAMSVPFNSVSSSGTFTVGANDNLVLYSGAGVLTMALPAASGCTGRVYSASNTGVGSITIDPAASELIDNASTVSVTTQKKIICTGTAWFTCL